jgi:hypothetical protein
MARVFLLSPANLGGERARMILNPRARFDLARRLAAGEASLGEVMSFVSGLYFRGKLTYARAFARAPRGISGAFIITHGAGLVEPDRPITRERLLRFADVPIAAGDPRFRSPLLEGAAILARRIGTSGEAILLGSIATDKYTTILGEALGPRLLFPTAFIGRGDMSRGGLLLRSADAAQELDYMPVAGAPRRGPRPARLPPRRPHRAPSR